MYSIILYDIERVLHPGRNPSEDCNWWRSNNPESFGYNCHAPHRWLRGGGSVYSEHD